MYLQVSKPEVLRRAVKEEELWSDIRWGDQDALARLFCLNYSLLFNYGYKMVANEALVKDSIQDLFFTIWRRHSFLNDAYSVKAYLIHSLRRILIRSLKKQQNRSDRNKAYTDIFSEDIYNMEDLMIHFEVEREQKVKLEEAIESLNKRQKEAIFLKYYGGASNDEIAQIMGINTQSVYNHISKAINNMRVFVNVA